MLRTELPGTADAEGCRGRGVQRGSQRPQKWLWEALDPLLFSPGFPNCVTADPVLGDSFVTSQRRVWEALEGPGCQGLSSGTRPRGASEVWQSWAWREEPTALALGPRGRADAPQLLSGTWGRWPRCLTFAIDKMGTMSRRPLPAFKDVGIHVTL